MTSTRSGRQSRPGSSRAPSVAHEILKRRDRPYKTEKQKFLIKRKKPQFHTFARAAPDGFTFVAVGTPELSERCKEISRERGLPVSVVNATQNKKRVLDPSKVSFHVHRVGYHFKAEVVEQACEELGYQLSHGAFIKSADLQAQIQKSHVARIMARHGLRMNQSPVQDVQDTPAQVRSAIKELFPKIPDVDLDNIVTHAWEEGSGRVGTQYATLELSRRVQLATVARIRHMYTDYDRLLKAFDWSDARAMVEPDTLKKLIEWRGENEEDDNELEEIVRETIVIDDDNDERAAVMYGSEADDEDSDLNDVSDASIEVTHHVAADDDMGAESLDETGRHFLQRLQPRFIRTEQQNTLARQKIGEARQRLRLEPPLQAANVMPMNVQVDERGLPPNAIVVDGTVYHRAPPVYEQPLPTQVSLAPQQLDAYGSRYPQHDFQSILRPYDTPMHPPTESRSRDNIVPSIEPYVPVPARELPLTINYGAPPATPDHQHTDKRRRVEYSPTQQQPMAFRPLNGDRYRPALVPQAATARPRHESRQEHTVIDLTSPDRHSRSSNPSPMRDVRRAPLRHAEENGLAQHYRLYGDGPLPLHPSFEPSARVTANTAVAEHRQQPPDPEPYDPRQPLVQFPDQRSYLQPHAASAAGSQPPPSGATHSTAAHMLAPPYGTAPYMSQPYEPKYYAPPLQQQTLYYEPQTRYVQVPAPVPPPVHGAPAPVQQSPHDVRQVYPAGLQPHQPLQQISSPAPPPPVNGAPHPAQYYYPR